MNTFEFTIVACGLDPQADDFEDRFFEAGCDDATIAFARGAILLQFARQAGTLEEAIDSAINNVKAAGAIVDRVEPDYLVSLSEIAERAQLTRQAISNYARGKRGTDFPHPIARVTTESPLWAWPEVAAWLEDHGKVEHIVVEHAYLIRGFNESLEDRHERRKDV